MEIQDKDIDRYFSMIEGLYSFDKQFNYDGNDRSIVIVGIAFIEDIMLYCLENFFPSNSSTVKRLLSHRGPIGTFSAKTDLLYSIGLISKVIKQDLDKLGQIRNEFAHKTTVSFDDEFISKLCFELKWHETVMMMKAPNDSKAIEVFKVAVNTIISHLNGVASISRGEKRKLKVL